MQSWTCIEPEITNVNEYDLSTKNLEEGRLSWALVFPAQSDFKINFVEVCPYKSLKQNFAKTFKFDQYCDLVLVHNMIMKLSSTRRHQTLQICYETWELAL